MDVKTIVSELRKLGNAEKIEVLKRFFKTGKGEYGEGDQFLGINVPETRMVAKKFMATDYSDIDALLHSVFHEVRLCGLLILVEKFAKAKTEAEQDGVVKFYLEHTHCVNNWDLVDLSCYKLLGQYLLKKTDRSLLYTLAGSGHLWSERIAMVSTYAFIREHQFDDTFRLATGFIDHPHDLMHKAVGWMLKESGKRDKARLDEYLQLHFKRMPRTMLRIAIEKHPYQEKLLYLKSK